MEYNLNKMKYAELKLLATSENLEFNGNISKDNLINLLFNHFKKEEVIVEEKVEITEEPKLNFEELMQVLKDLKEELKSKKDRNMDIEKNNLYIDTRILAIKNISDTVDEEGLAQIANLNKIKIENSRQFKNNIERIVELENKIILLDNEKMKLASIKISEKKEEYRKIKDEYITLPQEMLQILSDKIEKYNSLKIAMVESKKELTQMCSEFETKFIEPEKVAIKLTISEVQQVVNGLKNLNKIQARVAKR